MTLTEILPNHSEEYRSDLWGALTEHERAQLLQWNHTHADFPRVCTHELFELQVDRDPEAVAVVFGKRQLSYRELNEQANRVAHDLSFRSSGEPNTSVADRPSMETTASAHERSLGPRTGCARYALASARLLIE